MTDLGRVVRNYLTKKKRGGRIKKAGGGELDDVAYDPMTGAQITPTVSDEPAPNPQGGVSRVLSRLTGTQFGEPRYQTWPEKMVRSGVSLAGDVLSGEQPVLQPGLRREDYTDAAPPKAGDAEGIFGTKWFTPQTAQPNDPMMERAQDMAGLAGGQTLMTGAREGAIAPRAMVAAADSQATGAPLAALEHAPKFYSGLERVVAEAPIQKATGEQWLGTLANRGVKKDELEHSGTQAFLEQNRDVPLTKAEVAGHIGANKLELGEVNKGYGSVEDVTKNPGWQRLMAANDALGREYGRVEMEASRSGTPQPQRLADIERDMQANHDLMRSMEDGSLHGTTRYHGYQLPGGENYREKLLTMPMRRNANGDILGHEIGGDNYRSSHWDDPNVLVHRRTNERDVTGVGEDQSFKLRNKVSGNTTKAFPTEEAAMAQLEKLPANLRPNLEMVPAGQMSKRALHVEEIQSDWHQQGRQKGYAADQKLAMAKVQDLIKEASTLSASDPRYAEIYRELPALQGKANERAVPDAPFKKNWHELAIKDAIREAAEKGIDRISWTPGEAQAARYDLSQHVQDITVVPHGDGGRTWWPTDTNGRAMHSITTDKDGFVTKAGAPYGDIVGKSIDDVIGKDVAEKGHAATAQTKLSGADLSVGGEGMKGFYDKMIPDAMNKIGKAHGVKVEKGEVPGKLSNRMGEPPETHPVHYMDIPPSLKEQALKKGFSLFEDSAAAGAPLAALEHPVDAASGRRYTSDHAAAAAPTETGMDVRPGLAGPPGGAEGVRAAELQAQRWAGEHKPLPGLPQGTQIVEGQPFIPGPVAKAHDVAERYMADKDFGVAAPDKYHPIDVEHAKDIAKAFDEMAHAPNDPKVKAAYKALADETKAQYEAIVEHGGLKVTPVNGADYPYHGNPRAVVKDVADNKHMAFFKTDEGFGSAPVAQEAHPMLQSSGIKVGDHDMLYNDLFRVVHDYFGHVKNGYGFRGAGEDNAWRAHAAMYSPEARRAMTTETRGQNSWLNYGPHGEFNRTANAADTIYAPQKIGLLPDWVMSDRVAAPAIQRARLTDEAGLPIKGGDYTKASRAALDEIAAGPKGAGPLDLSTQGQIPNVPQVAMDRYTPPRGISPRMQAALDNPAVTRGINKSIAAGKEMGADKWYHTEPVRRAFLEALGPEQGPRAFSKFMDMVSATSPRSDVPTNIRNGSFYYQHALAGKELPEKLPYPFGHVAQNLHRSNYEGLVAPRAGNLSAGAPETMSAWDIYKNPKPASFSQNLQGNLVPGTMDTHAFRNIAMRTGDPRFLETSISDKIKPGHTFGPDSQAAKYGEINGDKLVYRPQKLLEQGKLTVEEAKNIPTFWATKPNENEYAAAEALYRKLGKKAGLPTADAQAAAWSGAGELTGLGTVPTHTFPELFNERVLYTAKMRGEDPMETLRSFVSGKKPLLARGGVAPRSSAHGYAEGGAAGDDYNTAVPDETAFQRWKAVNAPQDSGVDYDLRGAYLSNMQRAENGHMGDQFKKPNHPTFSDQSQYAVGDQRDRAGFWQGETFVPPAPRAFGGRTRRYAEGGDVDTPAPVEVASADTAPVFDPSKLAAAKPRAPMFDPAKLAAAKPKEMGIGDVASEAIGNAPASAWQFAQDVVRPVTHPIETLKGIKDLGLGLLEKSGAIGTIFPSAGGGHEQYADAMGKYLMDRYGSIENAKKSIAQDPVGVLSDASMVLTGGGSAAARLPGALGKVGEVTANIGRAVDPLMAPVNAARVGTKAVGELLTHTGATPLENAYRSGVEGGEAGDVFRGQMRGTSDMVEPVQMAKRGLEGYQAERGRNYREGMGDITSIDRQMDPLDRVLDFGKIDSAVANAERFHKFGTMDINQPATAVRNKMASMVDEWRGLDPATYHTIEGMDALKKSLGKIMMDAPPGTPARAAASEIYNAVRKTIVEYDPKYAKVMKDYELASSQIRELERAMSLGEKASADTALRKLQSIMRNNVNANYGRRMELGKLLEENGATHLMAALSGQSLNAWAPRGLGKLGAEAVALGAAGHFLSPMTLAAAPFMSPRLMGELAHGTGRTVGRALKGTNSLLSGVGGNRAAGNVSYRLGRATNPNPYAP